MNRFITRSAAPLLFALGVVAGCSKDRSSKGAPTAHGAADRNDSAAGTVDLGSTAYRPGPLGAIGSVAGTVRLDGAPPADTNATDADQSACDAASAAPATSSSNDLSNSVVWIADAKTGKALPIDKRIEISTERCIIEPRIQTAVVGSGINVFNDDRVLHKLVFVRSGTRDTVAVMPFFNDGQLVASDQLAKTAGAIEIRCEQHAWMHGYIMVFDHPYFAVTSSDGAFRIDSLPAGDYKLMVWHEGAAKPVERSIKVSSGNTAKANVAVAVGATP